MKLHKRLLSLILSVSLFVSSLSVPAFAKETDNRPETGAAVQKMAAIADVAEIEELEAGKEEEVEEVVEMAEAVEVAEVAEVTEIEEAGNKEGNEGVKEAFTEMQLNILKASASDAYTHVDFSPTSWQKNFAPTTPVSDMSIPMSHDSGTFDIKFSKKDALFNYMITAIKDGLKNAIGSILGSIAGWIIEKIFKLLEPVIKNITSDAVGYVQKVSAKCQDLTIKEQLNVGVRAFDLRFRYDYGNFNIYHGDESEGMAGIIQACECYDGKGNNLNLYKCFSDISDFLKENPTEFVFINVQNEGGPYSKQIEEELYKCEKKYGISVVYADRKYTKEVVDAAEPDAAEKRAAFPDKTYYSDIKGGCFDITGITKDNTRRSWDAKASDKIKLVKNAINNPDYTTGLTEIQCNVAVKLWKAHDPNHECDFPIGIKWIKAPWPLSYFIDEIPVRLTITFKWLIKSPHDQALTVNPEYASEVERHAKNPRNKHSLGIVDIDFITEKLCCLTANANVVTGATPYFDYKGNDAEDEEWDNVTMDYDVEDIIVNGLKSSAYTGNDDDGGSGYMLFTGTPENPVSDGSWSRGLDGFWGYRTTEKFINTWAYLYNPYAVDEAGKYGWFRFDEKGNMLTGWQYVDKKWYYLNPVNDGTLGKCFIGPGKTPDGYEVDAQGAWTGK